jgi:hypothetical protein
MMASELTAASSAARFAKRFTVKHKVEQVVDALLHLRLDLLVVDKLRRADALLLLRERLHLGGVRRLKIVGDAEIGIEFVAVLQLQQLALDDRRQLAHVALELVDLLLLLVDFALKHVVLAFDPANSALVGTQNKHEERAKEKKNAHQNATLLIVSNELCESLKLLLQGGSSLLGFERARLPIAHH